jgi:hypothetical protein
MTRTKIEQRKVAELASEYGEKGYEVHVAPGPDVLPGWMGNFSPDLLALREDDRVVVEVKSSNSLRASEGLGLLADLVDQQPGWRLELVLVKGRPGKSIAEPPSSLLSVGAVAESAQAARELGSMGYLEPAFLSAWVAFETAARHAFEHDGVDSQLGPPASIIKTLLSLGYVSDVHETELLRRLWEMRNRLVHGYATDERPSRESIEYLLNLSARLAGEAPSR